MTREWIVFLYKYYHKERSSLPLTIIQRHRSPIVKRNPSPPRPLSCPISSPSHHSLPLPASRATSPLQINQPTNQPINQSIRKPKPRRPIAHLSDLLLAHALHLAILVASLPARIDPAEIQRHAAIQHGRVADHGERDGVAFDVAGARRGRVQLSR